MSTKNPPNAPAAMSKLPLVMGLVCFIIGAVTLLYAGFATLKSAEHMEQAQQNVQQLENNWPRIFSNSQQALGITRGFASSTQLLARTNYRVKLALCGLSLLTVAAGGVLLFSARPRK
jgi:cell division protein FtsL